MSKTKVFVFGGLLVAALYDLWAVTFGGVDASISQFVTDTIGNYPFQMFMLGVLVCHFAGFTMKKR